MVRLAELGDVVGLNDRAARGQPLEPLTTTLRDDTKIRLRPIQPQDKQRIAIALELLSPHSRYLRFHATVDELTEEQLRFTTEVDHIDRVAWIALDAQALEAPAIALGQYARLEGAHEIAEASITVLDDYQGKGLGTMMLAILSEVALANGIEVFRNYVLSENDTMLELFDQLGAERQPITSEVQEVDLRLPRELVDLPDTPAGRAFHALADPTAHRSVLAAILPPVWVRRLRRHREPLPPPTSVVPHWRERGPFGDWIDAALAEANEADETSEIDEADEPHEIDGADEASADADETGSTGAGTAEDREVPPLGASG